MTESADSIRNNEAIEEDVRKIAQQIPGATTAEVLNAIGSESEQVKLSGNKPSNQLGIPTYGSKHSKHEEENVLDESAEKLSNTTQSNLKCSNPVVFTADSCSPAIVSLSNDPRPDIDTSNENVSPDKPQPTSEPPVDMVPECMYSVLQQKAQNVLKMISERKYPDSTLEQVTNVSRVPSNTNQSQSSRQSILKKSNESANVSNSKTSCQSASNLSGNKSSKIYDHSSHKNVKVPIDDISGNLSYNTLEQHEASQLLKENSSDKSPENKTFPASDSQQSSRSTEQCTTDYSVKNTGLDNVTTPNETVNDVPINEDHNTSKCGNLQQQCTPNISENVSAVTTGANDVGLDNINQVFSEQPNDVIKELSQIIDNNEMPIKLTKKGEHICQLFKHKLLVKLEANGNLDEKSAEMANITATKFAKWIDDILNEIDTRKKNKDSQKATSDLKGIKEEQEHEELFSPASRDSVNKTEDSTEPAQPEGSEVIKIQELSDSELIEKFGTYLLRESYDLFEFVGPDNIPVEVRHITAVVSKKIMIVKKKTSDTQWSNWVIEVGPEVTLESVSGSLSQTALKEGFEKQMTETDAGKWNLKKIGWDKWKPDMFKQKVNYCKIPLLKKQCMMTEADFGIEYPSYPAIYSQTTGDGTGFEESIAIAQTPAADPSPYSNDQEFL